MNEKTAECLLQKTLEAAQKRGARAADVLLSASSGQSFSVCDDELKKSEICESMRIGLRIWDQEYRQGVSSLTDIDESCAESLCDGAFYNASSASAEEDAVFAERQPEPPDFDLGLFDAEIVEWSPEKQVQHCLMLSKEARAADPRIKQVCSASISSGMMKTWGANSHGISLSLQTTEASAEVTVLAEEQGDAEIGGACFTEHTKKVLLASDPVEEAVRDTLRLLHGAPLPTGNYTLVLTPGVTADLLGPLSDFFLASSVCKKVTVLGDRMGEKVAPDSLTLVDDGRLYGGMGSLPADAEFVLTQRTTVLDRGRVSAWLCNLQYGKRLGMPSTGNGARGVGSLPDVEPNNFFVLPGVLEWESLVEKHSGCFCVTELMGLHTIDTVTGNFSLSARGLFYHKGLFTPVSQVTIAGNLLDFLSRITEVGGDLRFFDRIGGCSLVVEDIAVSGK